VERSLFTLDWLRSWLRSGELRRRANAGLNKGEARNALARAVFFHRLDTDRGATPGLGGGAAAAPLPPSSTGGTGGREPTIAAWAPWRRNHDQGDAPAQRGPPDAVTSASWQNGWGHQNCSVIRGQNRVNTVLPAEFVPARLACSQVGGTGAQV